MKLDRQRHRKHHRGDDGLHEPMRLFERAKLRRELKAAEHADQQKKNEPMASEKVRSTQRTLSRQKPSLIAASGIPISLFQLN
jgi:hypothetical protein